MSFVLEVFLFVAGFLLGLWYTAMLVLPIFYGVTRAFLGWLRKELFFRAVLSYLVAPLVWMIFFVAILAGMAVFWSGGFRYLRESGSFNAGNALGSLVLLANAVLGKKTKADMRHEFDKFVLPYKRCD